MHVDIRIEQLVLTIVLHHKAIENSKFPILLFFLFSGETGGKLEDWNSAWRVVVWTISKPLKGLTYDFTLQHWPVQTYVQIFHVMVHRCLRFGSKFETFLRAMKSENASRWGSEREPVVQYVSFFWSKPLSIFWGRIFTWAAPFFSTIVKLRLNKGFRW